MTHRAAHLLALLGALAVPQEPVLPADELPAALDRVPALGLPEVVPEPPENPFSEERAALGRRLFFDPVLSVDRSVSCASCHRPDHGFADTRSKSVGVRGRTTLRNAPTLLNRAFGRHFMWDGRFSTLEDQVLQPIENELEMGLALDRAVERLRADPEYATAFEAAFPGGVSRDNLGRALATFVRGLLLGDSPVDRFRMRGDHASLTTLQRTGLWVYESKGRCWKCHFGPNFTDEGFHNTGVGALLGEPVPERFEVTGDESDRGRFKTPTLRGLAFTAPYMHDGSLQTLEDVVAFYRIGGGANAHLDERLQPADLTDREAEALVAFLEALSLRSP